MVAKYFVEIGCWDGVLLSQTYNLEQFGWSGLCVDPFPRGFEGRTCQVASVAIGSRNEDREFVKVSIDRRYGGDVSYFSGFKDSISFHWPTIEAHCDYELIMIKTMTPTQLFKTYNVPYHIGFLSLDVEGAEVEILSSIDFRTYKFDRLLVEHNGVQKMKKSIYELLLENDYVRTKELDLDDEYIERKQYEKTETI